MNATTDPIAAARAAALFLSDLSSTQRPSGAELQDAIRRSLRTHGGSRGCAGDVAAAYGDHPDLAVARMRWARGVIDRSYPRPALVHPTTRTVAAARSRSRSRESLVVAA